jgi:hypothetical protein
VNPRQLEQDIELPNIKTVLVAYRDATQKSKWYIRFFVPGPDARYNPGIAVVSSSGVQKLLDALERAYKKMELLEAKDFTGKFSESFLSSGEVSDDLAVTVSSEVSKFLFWSYKNTRLHFFVSSKTKTFHRCFSSEDVKTVINRLSSAERLAAKLMNQL